MRYGAVIFDLLTALIDSWTLWNAVARGEAAGLRWRREYLRLTYGAGRYRPYEAIVAEAAGNVGLPEALSVELSGRWDEIAPWPEAAEVLGALVGRVPLAVVTNCSEALGRRAAARVGVPFDAIVTAERAGWYKPNPQPYRLALSDLGVAAGQALFVAGSPADVPGALGVGLTVVWHNRLALPPIEGAQQPRATYSTLAPLVGEVLGD